jgi:ketoreductase RED1
MKIVVIGGGVIGSSWTALFLAHGHDVVVTDPNPDIEAVVGDAVARIAPTLARLGLPTGELDHRLRFEPDLALAVRDADVVQENGPERLAIKQDLWRQVELAAPATALRLSSSSAITASAQGENLEDGSRLLVAHPFNPPHLLPLVEVVPGRRTAPDAVAETVKFFEALGKSPQVLNKEINGFVANRLQRAILREACYLVLEDVVTVAELDDIVTSSLGPRWAVTGLFASFDLGGGPGGLAEFFDKFAVDLDRAWKAQPAVDLDTDAQRKIIRQVTESFGAVPRDAAERARDDGQLAVLNALAHLTDQR